MHPPPSAWFGPHGGCTGLICRLIDGAASDICVCMYEFNNPTIAKSLANAARRGVSCQLIIDHALTPRERAIIPQLHAAGVRVWIDAAHQIMHHKFCVIDQKTTLTGSMNWTTQAEDDHAENVVIIVDPTLAWRYIHNAETHIKHSRRWTPPAQAIAA